MSDRLWWPTLRQLLLAAAVLGLAALVASAVYDQLLAGREQHYARQTYQGPLRLIAQQLLDPSSPQALPQRLSHLQHTLGEVKLQLLPLADFPSAEQSRLRQGELLYPAAGYGVADQVYQRLGDTPWVMRLQMPQIPPLLDSVLLAGLCFVLLAGGGLYLALIRPYWREVRTLQRAVEALGDGALATRIEALPTSSTLYPLAARMNLLAARISELLAAQRDLLHAVAHELRTPLARMFFQLEQLQVDPSAASAGLEANIRQMQALLEQVLHYASLEMYEPYQRCSRLDRAMLRAALQDFAGLHDEWPADLTLWADPALLPYALRNLVANALCHGAAPVWLTSAQDAQYDYLIVEDAGPGVPESERERIFNPLVRLGAGAPSEGAGLGLAITRRIARLHGGDVWVEAGGRAGGAKFILALPLGGESASLIERRLARLIER